MNEAGRRHRASSPEPQPDRADAIFVFDPALITDRGAVTLRFGD